MPGDATAVEVAAEAHRTGRTRIVIHEGGLDHCLGFIHAKDLLRLDSANWETTLARSLVRPLMVTPDHHLLEDLLVEMRTERKHISVTVDEHGTVVGLVTLEDVFEELIGDFDDESDDAQIALRRREEERDKEDDDAGGFTTTISSTNGIGDASVRRGKACGNAPKAFLPDDLAVFFDASFSYEEEEEE